MDACASARARESVESMPSVPSVPSVPYVTCLPSVHVPEFVSESVFARVGESSLCRLCRM